MLSMLASGQSPVYPGARPRRGDAQPLRRHSGPSSSRSGDAARWSSTSATPTTSRRAGPYLDGLRYFIVSDRGRQAAALQAGRVDVSFPGDTTRSIAEQLKAAVPQLVSTEVASNTSPNLLVNAARGRRSTTCASGWR